MKVKQLDTKLQIFASLIAFAILGSIVSALTAIDPGPIKPLSSAAIILLGTVCVYGAASQRTSPRESFIGLTVIFLVGATSEILGLLTGFPFGRYIYTTQWIPTVPIFENHNFPLLLPFAWTMVVGASALLANQIFGPKKAVLASTLTALIATLIDFVMEPVMVKSLNYWEWLSPTHAFSAPIQNAIGWFIVSFLASLPLTNTLYIAKNVDNEWSSAGMRILAPYLTLMMAIGILSNPPLEMHQLALLMALCCMLLIGAAKSKSTK